MYSQALLKPAQYLFSLALLTGLVLPLRAVSLQTARQGIIASLAARDQAYDKSSAVPFLQTYSPDWTGTNVSGQSNDYKNYSAEIAQTFAAVPSGLNGRLTSRLMSVSINRNGVEAIVMSRCQYPPKGTGFAKCYGYRSTTTDEIWGQSGNNWQEQSERSLLDRVVYSTKPLSYDLAEPGSQARAVTDSAVSRGIRAALSARANAYRHSKLNAYIQTFAHNFTVADVTGMLYGFRQVRGAAARAFAKHPMGVNTVVLFDVISAKKSGTDVEATVRERYAYPVQHTTTGNSYSYRTVTSVEVWTRNKSNWQQRSAHYIYVQTIYSVRPLST